MAEPINPSPLHSASRNEEMGDRLMEHIEEGKHEVPLGPEPLVCKPKQIESWRIFKIMSEFVEGFELLKKYSLAATFFGSTRNTFEDGFYRDATELAKRLATYGFAIITGGAGGIMEAANKGAYEAGGASIGLNIRLPMEQAPNSYSTDSASFDHFFVRKTMLTFASEIYIYFPGGYGTLDEFFEILTLNQTKKIKRVPIVLYGREYWEPLIEFMRVKMLSEHAAIDKEDLDLFYLADTVDEAYQYIIKNVKC